MAIAFEHLGGSRKGLIEQLSGARIGIGRDPANALSFDPVLDADVSTHHAEILLEADGRYSVADLGSRNGTFVDGARVAGRTAVPPGAKIRFGAGGPEVRCTYVPTPAPPPTAPPAAAAPAPRKPDRTKLVLGIAAGVTVLAVVIVVLVVALSGGDEPEEPVAAVPVVDDAGAVLAGSAGAGEAAGDGAGAVAGAMTGDGSLAVVVPETRSGIASGPAGGAAGGSAGAAASGAAGGRAGAAAADAPEDASVPPEGASGAASAARPRPAGPAHDEPPAPAADLHGDPLPEGAIARAGTIHSLAGCVQAFAFLPDDRSVAVACADDKVRLIDVESGKTVREVPGTGPLAVSPDGKTLALVEVSAVKLRSLESGAALRSLPSYPDHLSFSPDGRALVARGSAETDYVRLFDVATGKEIRAWGKEPPPDPTKPKDARAPRAMAIPAPGHRRDWSGFELAGFTPDGKTIAIFGNDDKGANDVSLCDARSGKEIRKASIPRWNRYGRSLAPDLSTGAFEPIPPAMRKPGEKAPPGERHPEVYDLATLAKLRSVGPAQDLELDRIVHSPDGKRLVSSYHEGGSVACFEVASGEEVWRTGASGKKEGLAQRFGELAFSPDGKTLLRARSDEVIEVRDAASGKEVGRIVGFPLADRDAYSVGVTFSPGGGLIAVHDDRSLRIHDAASRRERLALDRRRESTTAVAFSADGKTLAAGSEDRGLRLFEARTGKPLASARPLGRIVTAIAFQKDGKSLRTAALSDPRMPQPASDDGCVQSWDAASLKALGRVKLERCTFERPAAALSPDGGFVAYFAAAERVSVVDVATGKEVRSFATSYPEHVALSPTGERLAIVAGEPSLAVFDVTSGKRLFAVKRTAEQAPIWTAGISADGGTIAAARGFEILAWDLATGKKRQSMSTVEGTVQAEVRCLALSRDGALLAADLDRLGVWVFEVASGRRIHRFPGHRSPGAGGPEVHRVRSLAFAPDSSLLASGASDGTALVWRVSGPPR